MQFSAVIGQSTIKQQLVQLVTQNRVSHAWLFLGKEGCGGLPLALAFAQYLVCTQRNNGTTTDLFANATATTPSSVDACGICSACIKAQQLVHPDIHYTYPVIPSKAGEKPISKDYIQEWRSFIKQKPYGNVYDWLQTIGAENKQGNITARECDEIAHTMNLKSFESAYKILLLWMPEYLGNEGNKLLKLIEEPPDNTIFILVAENESLVLPTILSRTQLVKIPPIDHTDIKQQLLTIYNIPEIQAQQVASIAHGSFSEALHILQHADEDWQALIRSWLNAVLKGGPIAQVKWIEEASKLGREKQKQLLLYFIHLLEQSIRLRLVGAANMVLTDVEQDFAQRINKIADIAQQQCLVEELNKTIYYVERNANAKIIFHALTIRLYHNIQNKSLILTD